MGDFFAEVVKAGEPKEVEIPFGCNLVLNNASIKAENKQSASLYLETQCSGETKKVLLCTLIAGVVPQYSMEILVNPSIAPIDDEEDEKKKKDSDKEDSEDDDEYPFDVIPSKLIVEGQGEIHVTGVFVEEHDDYDDEGMYGDEDDDVDMDDEDEDEDDEDEDDEEEEEEEEEEEKVTPPPAKKPAFTPKKEAVKKEAPKSVKKEEPKKVETPKKEAPKSAKKEAPKSVKKEEPKKAETPKKEAPKSAKKAPKSAKKN